MRASSGGSGRGFTLLEIIMTGAILSIFMTMVCECMVLAQRNHTKSAQKLADLRLATASIEKLTRELRGCDKLYHPDPALPPLSTYSPWAATTDWLVFRTTGPNGPRVLGYHLDPVTQVLSRVVYRNDFVPTDPAFQVVLETHAVGQRDEAFQVTQLDPTTTYGVTFLKLDMQLSSESQPISVEVRVKNL